MHDFDWSEIGTLVAIIAFANSITLWAIKTLLSRHNQAIDDRFSELATHEKSQDKQIAQIRDALAQHEVDSARSYLRREDAVMFFGRAEQKIDAIWQFLHERFARGSASD